MAKQKDTFAGLTVEQIGERLQSGRSPFLVASDVGRSRQALIEWLKNRGLKPACLPQTKWELVCFLENKSD